MFLFIFIFISRIEMYKYREHTEAANNLITFYDI